MGHTLTEKVKAKIMKNHCPICLYAKKTTLKAPATAKENAHITSTSKSTKSCSETVTHRAKIMKIVTKKLKSV